MSELLGLLGGTTASLVGTYIEAKKIKKRIRNSKIFYTLVNLGINPERQYFPFFSLHENPYFIEDFINKPENPFYYSNEKTNEKLQLQIKKLFSFKQE